MPSAPSAHSIRNPGKPIRDTRKRSSDAERATKLLKAAENRRARVVLNQDADEFYQYREQTVQTLAIKHKKKESYIRALLTNASSCKKRRKVNLYNAILHDRGLKAKEGM